MHPFRINILYIVPILLIITFGCQQRVRTVIEEVETGSMNLPADQEFEVAENSTVAVEKSLARGIISGGFLDSDGDGIADTAKWGEMEIRGDVNPDNIKGYAYNDGRYVVFYPAELTAFPAPGEVKLFGFFHYFDDHFLNIALAVVVKQKRDDPEKTGLVVMFLGDFGLRVGNTAYGFYPRRDIQAIPSYSLWTKSGLDFAIATDPKVDQFFIILKDFGLPDEIFVVAYKWY